MSYVLPPPPQASVAVAGSADRFPVRRIFCVGRNYAAHAREMGKDPDREPPFFFMKPADAVVDSGSTHSLPAADERAPLRDGDGRGARERRAEHRARQGARSRLRLRCGLDLTRRDLQQQAKDMGRPWDFGKGFDRSAPCAPIHRAAEVGHPEKGRIWLSVNGAVKQDGDLSELIWPIPDIIAILSQSMRLEPGDLIFSGTPAGVGAVKPGDKLNGGVVGLTDIAVTIGEPER